MSDLETPTPTARSSKPGSNVYTVLVFVAFAALAMAIGVMWVNNTQLTGTGNPFQIVK